MRKKKENEKQLKWILGTGKKDYCKPVRAGNFWNKNYIEYESIENRNKALSVKEYLKIFYT